MRVRPIVTCHALVAILAAYVAAPAAATLCRRKSGTLFARASCKKREQVVAPADLGIPGAAGAQGDRGTKGAAGGSALPFVVAADGTVVGEWHGSVVAITSPFDGRLVLVAENALIQPQSEDPSLFHADGACKTTALMDHDDDGTRVGEMSAGRLLYPGDPIALHAVGSVSAFSTSPCPAGKETAVAGYCCVGTVTAPRTAGPVRIIEAAALGARPFHLESR